MLRRFRAAATEAVRNSFSRKGFDIVKQPHVGQFIASRDCDLVIDVGANEGQFGQIVRGMGYAGRIVSFEPTSAACSKLLQVSGNWAQRDGNPLWRVHQIALGAAEGSVDINVSEYSVFSSMKPLADGAAERYAAAQTRHVERVEVRRLDDMVKDGERILLKIDTQGYEREVLEGAPATLDRCVGVLMEVPVTNLYAETWSFGEVIAFMDGAGFVPVQIKPVGQDPLDPASALEFDILFARKDVA